MKAPTGLVIPTVLQSDLTGSVPVYSTFMPDRQLQAFLKEQHAQKVCF